MNIVTPEAITIMTTFKCTAECEECCYQCSRNRNERLGIMTIKSYIKESREVFHNLKAVYFTGGECFLLGNDLIEAISYATSLKLLTRCVTNGYWGKDSKKAFDLAAKLKKAGLKEINFSTGDNHQKFVPIDSVIEAAIACATNGIRTLIIVEGSKDYAYKLEELRKDPKFLQYNETADNPIGTMKNVWISLKDGKRVKQDKELYFQNKDFNELVGCENIFLNTGIDPNSRIVSC
ncbi:radical SAM protein [Enterococcus hirae]|nr:radical SAM protein [Enterococcus hirae]